MDHRVEWANSGTLFVTDTDISISGERRSIFVKYLLKRLIRYEEYNSFVQKDSSEGLALILDYWNDGRTNANISN